MTHDSVIRSARMPDDSDDQQRATAFAAPSAAAATVADDDEDRLRREVADLRRQVARLGLALQIERERAGGVTDGGDQKPAFARRAHRALDVVLAGGVRATESLKTRASGLRTAGGSARAPAMAWTRPRIGEAAALTVVLAIALL